METVWKKVLSEIQLEVSPAVFATLFKNTQLMSLENGVAKVTSPSPILSTLIETRYYALLKKVLDKYLEQNVSVVFASSGVKRTNGEKRKSLGPLFAPSPEVDVAKKAKLNPLSTFDNFAVSGTNQLAFAAAQTVAQKPASTYNPLFLYGGVGVGKTHLMQAIGNAILTSRPKTKIIFCAGEEFTNEIVFAIRNKTTREFKEKFRNTDVLFIDDIQFIAGKDTVQEEFFHTFNAVMARDGQIVLTSDKPPEEIKDLEKRLSSRFAGGLMVDIEPPDFGLRVAIILIKAKLRGLDLPIDIAKILASQGHDARKLEGLLTRLIGEASAKNIPIDGALAEKISKNGTNGNAQKIVRKEDVIDVVANFYNVRPTQIKGSRRNSFIVLPRQIVMYLLRHELNITLPEIGNILGGRDHTTIMHGVTKIEQLVGTPSQVSRDVKWIKSKL